MASGSDSKATSSIRRQGSAGEGVWDRIWRALFSPVDNAFLVYLRVLFGGIMFWDVMRFVSNEWIHRYYIYPRFYFSYFGFEWVKPWPGNGMYVHFAVMGTAALMMLVGLFYRPAAVVFFVTWTYLFLLDETQYLNHFYLIGLMSFMLIFLPVNRAWSLDAWRKPSIRTDMAPGWTLWLLRAQIGLVYFYAGIAKVGYDWLHGEPMRMWLSERTDFPVLGRFFHEEWMVYGFSYGGMMLDLFIAPCLLWRRTRIWAFLAGCSFHLMNTKLFSIGIFPWFMLFNTLVFFPPDSARRIVVFLTQGLTASRNLVRQVANGPVSTPRTATRHERLVVAALAVWFTYQILMPLRHHLYPGNVMWTEEGHRFSWRMKLRDKEGAATFYVKDKKTGETWPIDSRDYLTSRQRNKMVGQPDMLLQFGHFIGEAMKKEGHEDIEVHVRAVASVNSRERQFLLDPEVDLLTVHRQLWPAATWIVPLYQPLPLPGQGRNLEEGDLESEEPAENGPEESSP